MTNKEIESYRNSYRVVNGIGFCRVNNDINGNPRYEMMTGQLVIVYFIFIVG